jgi:hypothetical protein
MNEDESFEIIPYIGAKKICFGMTPHEIEKIYGHMNSVTFNHLKQRVEFRSFTNIGYSPGLPKPYLHQLWTADGERPIQGQQYIPR